MFSPQLIILGATDAYLRETFTEREKILGKYLFDVFPDNPAASIGSVSSLRASIEQVLLTGKPQQMGTFQYDIRDPNKPGAFIERYWSTTHTPVLDEQGEIVCILHETVNVSEEVKARAELKESQEREQEARAEADQQRLRLERLFEQAPAAIALLDGPDLVYKVLNKAYEQLFPGRPLLGLPLFEALPELLEQPIAEILRKVYQTGETYEGREQLIPVARYHDQPMEDIYWNFIYQALFDAQGQVSGILIFALDVTSFVSGRLQVEQSRQALQDLNRELEERVQRRTWEVQLAQAEAIQYSQRLNGLFMQAPAAICILEGPELVFELVNPSYAQLFPGRRLLGRPLIEALPEIQQSPIYDQLRKVYATGNSFEESELYFPLARHEGGAPEDRYFRYIQQARYNEHGEIDGLIIFAFELTEQVAARKAVEASAQQLRLITDSLPVLIGYLDHEERYRFTNKAYEKWFPLRADDLLGRPVREVVGEKAYSNVKGYIERALAGHRVDFEATMPYREGFTKQILTSYVPDIREGEVQGFYTLVTDITDQAEARLALEESERNAKAMAGQLATANQELQAANAELGKANQQLRHTNIDLDNFIYTASHDLRAPISNIERLLEELLLELPEESVQQREVKLITGMMQNAVERFKKTIFYLTEITRLQKDEPQEAVVVNLEALVEGLRLDLARMIEEAGARIELDLDGCPAISFSAKNLRSIVYNLVTNAIKYRHPEREPVVQLSCHQDDEHVVLTVKDNGLGLSLQNQSRLFTMFRRFHDHVEGSGVGLYMVKRIVDNAGGRIEVESEIGVGTTFTLYFRKQQPGK